MVHSTFYYPITGGSQFIIDKLLSNICIYTDTKVNSVSIVKNKVLINSEPFDAVIYTGDIRKLGLILNSIHRYVNQEYLNYVESLCANYTSNLLCECDANDYSWIYIPGKNYKCHRIIMTGNFSKNNNGICLNESRTTCTVEFSGKVDKSVMINEIKKLPFNMQYVAHNSPKPSYVIQDESTRSTIKNIQTQLEYHGLFLCGRFAQWEYYNMDKAIDSAMTSCSKIIKKFGVA
jgi:protoporphyrinogen oxidase